MESLGEIRSLKSRLEGPIHIPNEPAEDSDSTEENQIAKSKTLGFKKTSPQSEAELKLQCEVCKKTFNRTNALKTHIKSHTTDGDWNCKDCSFQTYSQENLKIHKQKAHPEKGATAYSPGRPKREVRLMTKQVLASGKPVKPTPATTVRQNLSTKSTLKSMFVKPIEPSNLARTSPVVPMVKDAVIITENTLRVVMCVMNVETSTKPCMI